MKLDWAGMKAAELVKLLDEPRPAVRSRAIESLGKRGGDAVADLAATLGASSSVEARRNAVWALTRIEGAAARAAVRQALNDPEETIRQAACHSVAVWRDAGALPQLLVMLKEGTPAVRRASAEALGRIGDKQAVPELLASAAEGSHSGAFSNLRVDRNCRCRGDSARPAGILQPDPADGNDCPRPDGRRGSGCRPGHSIACFRTIQF